MFIHKTSTIDEHTYCYKYTKKYLGGIAALEVNPKISYSVLVKLGRPKATEDIKQKFAERIKFGEKIIYEKVEQAIGDELLTTIPSNQIDDLEQPLIEIKKLLNSQDNKESNYHKWLQQYNWVFGFDYKLIESFKVPLFKGDLGGSPGLNFTNRAVLGWNGSDTGYSCSCLQSSSNC